MFRFASRFRCGENECVVLRKNGRPLVVESPYVEQALQGGAEPYPETCAGDAQCWVEIPEESLPELESELEWLFGW